MGNFDETYRPGTMIVGLEAYLYQLGFTEGGHLSLTTTGREIGLQAKELELGGMNLAKALAKSIDIVLGNGTTPTSEGKSTNILSPALDGTGERWVVQHLLVGEQEAIDITRYRPTTIDPTTNTRVDQLILVIDSDGQISFVPRINKPSRLVEEYWYKDPSFRRHSS